MTEGKEVAAGLRAGADGGIPWFGFLDASETLLTRSPQDSNTESILAFRRREEAVLATADGPQGNVGCPMTKIERAHFLDCINNTRNNITDKDVKKLAKALRAYAMETIGEDADSE